MFFEDYFEINSSAVEVNVACPFTHHTINGIPYLEANPSAHINTQERVFHCKACGVDTVRPASYRQYLVVRLSMLKNYSTVLIQMKILYNGKTIQPYLPMHELMHTVLVSQMRYLMN